MSTRAKPAPSHAPLYCAIYPEIAKVVRPHGYALAIHGSLQRDFDLVCIPWVENASEPDAVIEAITSSFAIRSIGGPPTLKAHGRLAYTLAISFADCAIDLSFMPVAVNQEQSKSGGSA